MALLFDTSIIIGLERGNKDVIKKISELSKTYSGRPQVSFITYYEFMFGIKNRSPKNQADAVEFINNFYCLPATKKTAEILAELRNKYLAKGLEINLADFIIASHAKENSMVLVTKDRAFEKIEEIDKIII